jgi:hypothetical protein
MEHKHNWTLSFTGKIGTKSFAYYRCTECKEIEEREEETTLPSKDKIKHTFGNGI